MTKAHEMIRVRGATKHKLQQIAEQRGWKVAEAADRAADALAEKEGVEVPAIEQPPAQQDPQSAPAPQ